MDDPNLKFSLFLPGRQNPEGRFSTMERVYRHASRVMRVFLIISLFWISACVSSTARVANESGQQAQVAAGIAEAPDLTAAVPESQSAGDDLSRKVARNLASGLKQVFEDRALSAELAVARPGNSFEYHLLEQLQLAGFSLFVANPDASSTRQLYYEIERVEVMENTSLVDKSNTEEMFKNYLFRLTYQDFDLGRQYKVGTGTVSPASPMWLTNNLTDGTQLVAADDSEF